MFVKNLFLIALAALLAFSCTVPIEIPTEEQLEIPNLLGMANCYLTNYEPDTGITYIQQKYITIEQERNKLLLLNAPSSYRFSFEATGIIELEDSYTLDMFLYELTYCSSDGAGHAFTSTNGLKFTGEIKISENDEWKIDFKCCDSFWEDSMPKIELSGRL